jgi:transposase
LSSALPQYCWAHLIREVRYFSESDDKSVACYGKRLLEAIGEMFKTIHRQDKLSERTWLRRMRKHQELILKWARFRVPKDKKVLALSKRLRDYPTEYFRFIESGLPPTNNLCEQSIRRVVIDRKVTQGTRSDWGNRWLERFWSVLSTCEQRGKNVMIFLKSCMDALIHGLSPPKLLKD